MRHSNTRPEDAGGRGASVRAFAPGRVNLVGEHTDYNDGLCLAFAIERGVQVRAEPVGDGAIRAIALDLDEQERFRLGDERDGGAGDWRCFVRGAAAELRRAGIEVRSCRLEIDGDVPRGSGLASSAALSVALCLALCAVAGVEPPERVALARLCSRIENDWCGARTGLLDPLAALFGEDGHALRIDMRGPRLRSVPLDLRGHVLATLASGAEHSLAGRSGYNERRQECEAACRRLGIGSLRDASHADGLPEPLDRRVRHVLSENARVDAAVAALEDGDLGQLGRVLDASHASLRDDYEVSVPEVERAVEACRRAGAIGARIMGGGFGGSVLALFPPEAEPPSGAVTVEPGPAARLP